VIVEQLGALRVLRFPTLRRTGIVCAHSTVPLNARREDDRARLAEAAGFDPALVSTPVQVHHARIVRADEGPLKEGVEADGVVCDTKGQSVLLRGADCSLVIIVDPEIKAFGVAHAGWRGAARGVVVQLARAMEVHYGAVLSECRAAVGPTIGLDRYEVGPEVPAAFIKHRSWAKHYVHSKAGKLHLDLAGINARFLQEAGIPKENIEVCKLCTYDNPDLLHSYRREGEGVAQNCLIAGFPNR